MDEDERSRELVGLFSLVHNCATGNYVTQPTHFKKKGTRGTQPCNCIVINI